MTEDRINKLVRVGQLAINIEKITISYEADAYYPAYSEKRLRLSNPYKNYEVSLMKNWWLPDRCDEPSNYREVATIDLNDDNYIEDGRRWMINDATALEVLKKCLVTYYSCDTIEEFHEAIYND